MSEGGREGREGSRMLCVGTIDCRANHLRIEGEKLDCRVSDWHWASCLEIGKDEERGRLKKTSYIEILFFS